MFKSDEKADKERRKARAAARKKVVTKGSADSQCPKAGPK